MNQRTILFCIFLLGISSLQTFCQPEPPPGPPRENMLQMLSDKLNLNDEQVDKVELILNITKGKMKELRDKQETERDQFESAMNKVMKEQDKEIEKLLTEDQKKIFADMKKQRNEQRPPMDGRQGPPPMGNRPR